MKQKTGTNANWILALCLVSPGMAMADASLEKVEVGSQSPSAVCPGAITTNLVTVTRLGGGNQDAYLSVSNLPPGASASFSQNPLKFSSNNETLTTTMWISTSINTPPGSNPITLTAKVGIGNFVTTASQLEVTMCSPGGGTLVGDGFYVALIGSAGQIYNVQATTNLLNPFWVTLCTTNCPLNNLLIYVDRDYTNYPMRFYRLAAP